MTGSQIATPFPLPTFKPGRDGEATSADLLTFLQTLISENLGQEGTGKIPDATKESWAALIDGLSEHFLATLPTSSVAVWSALDEKVSLCQATLDVIERVANCTGNVFTESDERSLLVLYRLLAFLNILCSWDPVHIPEFKQKNKPDNLRKQAIKSCCSVVFALREDGFKEATVTETIIEQSLAISHHMFDLFDTVSWPLQIDYLHFSQINEDSRALKLEVGSVSQLSFLLVDILLLISVCMKSAKPHGALVTRFDRETVLLLGRAVNLFISPHSSLVGLQRDGCIARLVDCLKYLNSVKAIHHRILDPITTNILLMRLQDGPSIDWKLVDSSLQCLFEDDGYVIEDTNSVEQVISIIVRERWPDGEFLMICACLAVSRSLKSLHPEFLLIAHKSLLQIQNAPAPLTNLINAINEAISGGNSKSEMNIKEGRRDEIWREHMTTCIDFFLGNELHTLGDLPDVQWVIRLLDLINLKLSRPSKSGLTTVDSRETLANALKDLVCATAHHDSNDCMQNKTYDLSIPSLIPAYLVCLKKLQTGPEHEVKPAVSRAAQCALAACIRHDPHTLTEENFDAVVGFIQVGLQHSDRTTRLASGRALVEVIRVHTRNEQIKSENLDLVFGLISNLLEKSKDVMKETTLITIALIGKIASPKILERVIFFLVVQLSSNNILLKGLAYTQLLSLAKVHKKTPYMLLSPYMDKIAGYVVSIMSSKPNTLLELCRFLSLSSADFFSITLSHTLPQLFATCNMQALETIGKELEKSVSSLFLNASADVLAHVYVLNDHESEKAIDFILRTLCEAANNAKIGLPSVIKSCIIPLLGKLVISMGDQDQGEVKKATLAIAKVEQSLNASPLRSDPSWPIGDFLKGYMLGIIAVLNDVLQDIHGRKSDELKRKVLLGLNTLIEQIGYSISIVSPQVMATLQTTVFVSPLADAALQTWYTFIINLRLADLGPHVGPTTAALVNVWPTLSDRGHKLAMQSIDYILQDDSKANLGKYLEDIADFSIIPELKSKAERLRYLRRSVTPKERLQYILERTYSHNTAVAIQALEELKVFMSVQYSNFTRELASGFVFDSSVGEITKAILGVACRDGEGVETLRSLAFECIGILGAVDPDRFDISLQDTDMVVLSNYADESEAIQFALHLVQNTLVGAFRSTSDIKYQSHLAFAIQELLRFCKFTPDVVLPGASIPLKVRTRWNSLPKHVLETITPLLEARFAVNSTNQPVNTQHPIYHTQSTYREWIQVWTAFLITRTNGQRAKTIFDVFRLAVRNKDVSVAHQLLPHLVLNVLISGDDDDTKKIRDEITAVLEDQLDPSSKSSSDKRLLSAQAVFMLMDHLNKWIRILRQEISFRRNETRRSRQTHGTSESEIQVTQVDSILSSIDQTLVAKAAFQCKSYARSLMNFEKQILSLKNGGLSTENLQIYFDRLHEIYSHLDEPDGMEGVSILITLPSIEHQIRQHESTGRWTSAQSCWEVRLQQNPDRLDYHLGLLRCLRNLGHYDSLRTHIQGVLVRNPEWENDLAGFRIEGAWMSGSWDTVEHIVGRCKEETWEIAIARLLLALRSPEDITFTDVMSSIQLQLGRPITAAGERGYRRAYDAALKLHLVHDIKVIRTAIFKIAQGYARTDVLPDLFGELSLRLDSTLPTFRTREPILSIHRTAFSLSRTTTGAFKTSIGRAWLDSAKIARKAGHWQTAYSAILQAQECHAALTFFQSAKLVKASGEPLRALHELDSALHTNEERRHLRSTQVILDLEDDVGIDDEEMKRIEDKAKLLRARWMQESERYDTSVVFKEFSDVAKSLSDYESAHFHAGHFQDECYKVLTGTDKKNRGPFMNLYTVKAYAMAIRLGSKYAYQTIPRLLTLWLDMGEDTSLSQTEVFKSINTVIQEAITHAPVYKWLTAFPQIVSRVDHKSSQVSGVLAQLIGRVLCEYPQQGLWLFMSVVKSTKSKREKRGRAILEQLKSNPRNAKTVVPLLVEKSMAMTAELLRMCDYPIKDDSTKTLSMNKNFPALAMLAPSPLIIPLQESMTVSLPATSSSSTLHQPFPPDAPTIQAFFDDIDIMKSLAKPRKIKITGSDGKVYIFLGKPKDDLRKDARLMDFNSIINKLLRTNSESRRRQLRIRTYSVVTLNEECGFIQWVPNTMPIRPILMKYYSGRGIEGWNKHMALTFSKIKDLNDREAATLFKTTILNLFPPIFHEWFLDTFPEPTTWLSSRLAYGRTAAVMSMVGFILGLGDRHLENILLDVSSGDVVHVDFNCLFEKGKTLETPERVPFRLTCNMVDGLGVTGVEGVFRKASEITMQLLRDNKDVLMSVLDAFIHDPLVEWEDEKRKMERQARRADFNGVKESVDLRKLAKNALLPIERKLRGLYMKETNHNDRKEKEVSISNLVQMLIEEATDLRNLAKMYPGWAPWH